MEIGQAKDILEEQKTSQAPKDTDSESKMSFLIRGLSKAVV